MTGPDHEPCTECGGYCNHITPELIAQSLQVGVARKRKFTLIYYGFALALPVFAYLWQGPAAAGFVTVLFGMYFCEAQVSNITQGLQTLQQKYLQMRAEKKIKEAIGRSDDEPVGGNFL